MAAQAAAERGRTGDSDLGRLARCRPGEPPTRALLLPTTVSGEPLFGPVPGDVRRDGARRSVRQLIGESRLNAAPFAYCGSIGPLRRRASPLERQIVRCGQMLGSEFGLRGLFGVDFLLDADSVAWLTEVNPRYTASVEVLEDGLGISLLGEHVQASAAFETPIARDKSSTSCNRGWPRPAGRAGTECAAKRSFMPRFALRAPSLAELMRLPGIGRAASADRRSAAAGTHRSRAGPAVHACCCDDVSGLTGSDRRSTDAWLLGRAVRAGPFGSRGPIGAEPGSLIGPQT